VDRYTNQIEAAKASLQIRRTYLGEAESLKEPQ
jgi:hypothetical protein